MNGGDGDVVIWFVRGHVSRCGGCPWRRPSLGVRLRGGLLVGMRCFGVFVIGELRCELLFLLAACGILRLSVFCSVTGDTLSLVASILGVGL